MLDINLIRDSPNIIKKDLEKRGEKDKTKLMPEILKLDSEWRKYKLKIDNLRHQRNELSQSVNQLMKQGKKKEAQAAIKKAKTIPGEIEKQEKKAGKIREKLDSYLFRIPNILHDSVPKGNNDKDNKEVRRSGKAEKKKVENHGKVAEALGIVDFKKAGEVSGAGFHYLLGDLAMLNQALIQYSIDYMVSKGFKLVIPPLMMRRKPYEGVVDLTDFENVMYKIEDEDLYMIATSEHPMAAMLSNTVTAEKDLPLLYVGFSPCFRKEIGSHGVDTKGLFRVHQFWKVEMFVFCTPEESWKWHEKLIKYSEEIYKNLGLPFRVVNVCTGDIGSIAAKKYDLELWMPRQNAYKEACSCSNCTDYQARRLNIKYDAKDGTRKFVHTLNNTALATSRTMVAILENFQNKDGSISVPKVLKKYMGKDKIKS